MNNEPVMTVEAFKSIVIAILAVMLAFNVWEPTTEQTAAILGLIAIVFPIVQRLFVRPKVAPLDHVAALKPA